MRTWWSGVVLCTGLLFTTASHAGEQRELILGRQCANDFYQGRLDALWARMTPDMQKVFGTKESLLAFHRGVSSDLGEEANVQREQNSHKNGFMVYARESRFTKTATPFVLQCTLNGEEKIAGFLIQPAKPNEPAPTAYLNYETKSPMRLPFEGEWFTFWGGRTVEQNYHAAHKGQRFAYDFLVVKDGKSHTGDRTVKENYFCWDKKILAPAAGTVVVAKDGLIDNKPGVMDGSNPAGNHVLLDLGNGEYAVLAHLRQGSVKVIPGEKVVAGQELGRCGNSGNTSEPHLHFHLQNANAFGQGEGLPAFFNHYVADGKPVTRGEPLRGQTISSAP